MMVMMMAMTPSENAATLLVLGWSCRNIFRVSRSPTRQSCPVPLSQNERDIALPKIATRDLRVCADQLFLTAKECSMSGPGPRPAEGTPAPPIGGNAMLQLAENLQRLGTETAFAVLARANALERQGRESSISASASPTSARPTTSSRPAIKALRDGHHGYTPANGILPLREAVAADLHKRHGVDVSPDSVMIMPGGKPTMFMSILMFGEPGAEIMYPDPGFPIYRSMIEFTGATPVPVPIREENGFAFSAEETLSLITPKTRLLILNSPANPTGGVTPKAEIDKLVAGLEQHPDVAIMSDEIYEPDGL